VFWPFGLSAALGLQGRQAKQLFRMCDANVASNLYRFFSFNASMQVDFELEPCGDPMLSEAMRW